MSWGNVAGAAIGVIGGALSNRSENKGIDRATRAQQDAAREANRLQWDMYSQSRTDNEPFRQNAIGAQSMFMQMLGLQPYSVSTGGGAQPQPTQPPGGPGLGKPGGPAEQPGHRPPLGVRMVPSGVRSLNPTVNREGVGGLLRNFPQGNPRPGGLAGLLTANTGGPGQVSGGAPQATTGGQSPPPGTPNPNFQQQAFDLWRSTPGYQFNLDEGRNQLESSAAARGNLYSGAAMKALTQYGQNYADRTYGDYMNRLASVANMGQTANSQNAQMGMNYANNAGANLINSGNARASGLLQKGRNNADLWGGIAGLANNAYQDWWSQRQGGGG